MAPYTTPVPATWTSGPVKAPLLRGNVSDTIALLSRPPMFYGQQTTTSQSIPGSTYTAVQLDTEIYDNLAGHVITNPTTNPYYYAMFPGWYLCEATVPLSNSGAGTTLVGVSVGGVQNGGSYTNYGGTRILASTSASCQALAVKLMKMQQTGTYGTGDYINAAVLQNNASAQPLTNTASTFPYLTCRWVAALSGTTGLPVPSNPAWPSPAAYVTSAFLNSNIRDAIRFLIYPPVMEYSGATGTLASVASLPATGTTVSLITATVDNYSAYSGGVWTAPVAGEYYCYGCVAVTTGASANSLAAGLTVTSSNYNSGTTFTIWGGTAISLASTQAAQAVRRRLRLNAGDTVSLAAAQNDSSSATANLAGSAPHVCRMIIVWQGA